MRIVHEGRGGYIAIDDERYPIEHVQGGRFCIHFRGDLRRARVLLHLEALRRLVMAEPTKWAIETR